MIIKDKGKVIPEAVNRMSIVTNHAKRITDHYAHAREKHPYFCDKVGQSATNKRDEERIKVHLGMSRQCIAESIEHHNLHWEDILDCQVWEVFDALARGDKAHAIEYLYDMIAVCLRTIDVLEGRQKLGKPEAVKERHCS